MSNSRKRVPIAGVTGAPSDKRYKRAEHSRERATVKIALAKGIEPPSPRIFGDPWSGEKDGKLYRPGEIRLMRK